MPDNEFRLPFDGFSDPEVEANEPANDFWEDIAETLDKIEQNTRGYRNSAAGNASASSPQVAPSQSRQPAPIFSPKPRQREQSSTPVAGPSQKAPGTATTSGLIEHAASREKKTKLAVKSVAATHVSNTKADEKKKLTTEIRHLEAVSKKQTNGILKELKTGISKWDGSVAGMKLNTSNIGDMVGMALGGPFWTAFKELKDVVIQDSQNSEKSLSNLFKKTFPRKLDSKAQGGRQRDSNGRFIGGDTARQQLKLAEESHALAEQQVATGKKRHDELVKAVKANRPKTNLFGRGGLLDSFRRRGGGGLPGFGRDRRVAVPDARMPHASNSGRVPQGSAHPPTQGKAGKPHGRGRKAGLLAGAAALFGGGAMYMGSRGDDHSALDTASTALDTAHTATQASKAGAEKAATNSATKISDAGAKGSTIEATGKTTAQEGKAVAEKAGEKAVTKTADAGATTAKTASTAGKTVKVAEAGSGKAATSIGGKAAALGAKGAMGAAKAIPVAGQLLAAGMAVYDGVNGWNDTEMHQQAFGLREGEEASTGQKASAAAANVLDMGGLLTGGASLLGFDVSTADIAKGIYAAGDKVGEVLSDPVGSIAKAATGLFDGIKGFFGGGDKEKEENKEEKSPENEPKPQAEEKPDTSAADIATTAALVAAPAGIMAAAAMKSVPAPLPIADTSANLAPNTLGIAKRGISPLAVGAVGAAGAAGVYVGTKALLSDDKQDQEKEDVKSATTLGGDKIPSLLESLTKALTDLTEKLEQQIKQAANSENGGVFNIFGGAGGFGGGSGGGYGGSGSGSYSSSTRSGGSGYSSNATYSGLGDVVLASETGGKGTAMISSGKGDKGGVSYGRSQLASKVGSIPAALKWARSHGYEDIANELEPLMGDATNRNGQFAQKWAQLAAEKGGRLEQFDRAYQKQGYYDPMMAKIRRENPELAKRIDANPALQEQVLSTAVQYGPNSGRYLSAANEVLSKNANATDRELLTGIQNVKVRDVGTNFASSSANVQAGVANRHRNTEMKGLLAIQDRYERGEIKIYPQTGTGQALPGTPLSGAAFAKAPSDILDATSMALQANTQDAINRHVKYSFGSKNSRSGGIDCSGWVAENTRAMMEAVNTESGKPIYSKQAKQVLNKGAAGGAAGIIQSVSTATGEMLGNSELAPDKVREGMMIGLDTGYHGWDNGRFNGIDHIVQTYRDQNTGRMMVSESRGKRGVMVSDYEEWYNQQQRRGTRLYGTDFAKLADASQSEQFKQEQTEKTALAQKQPEDERTALAESSPEANQQPEKVETLTAIADSKPEDKPQSIQVASAGVQQTENAEPVRKQNTEPVAQKQEQEAPKTVALAQNNPIQSIQSALSQTGSLLANIPGVNSDFLSPVQNVLGKAQSAMDMVKSPQAMIENFVPKEAQPLVAKVQKVAGDLLPLTDSVGSLLPGSESPFLNGAKSILGQIAKPQFPSSLPDPMQFFGQPLQVASNVMQAMPQIPTRLPDPAELMPTQSMQQNTGFDVGPIVNVLTELLDVTRKNTQDKEKAVEDQNTCNIPMDFDDAYCFRFAHDMALG